MVALVVGSVLLGLLGPDGTQSVVDSLNVLGPGQARDLLVGAIEDVQNSDAIAGLPAIIAVATAPWSCSRCGSGSV